MAVGDRIPPREAPPSAGPYVRAPLPDGPPPAPRPPAGPAADDRSLGDLFSELSVETRTLVRQEIALAQAEFKQKAKKAGRNAGFMVAGGLVAYVGLFALAAAAILLLGLVMAEWLAALIVGVLILLIGYGLVKKGMNGLKETDFSLERTAETLKEDKKWLKHEVKE